MHHHPDIASVDAHPKGGGGDNDRFFVPIEEVLDVRPSRSAHAGVIWACGETALDQALGHLFGVISGCHVHDGAAPGDGRFGDGIAHPVHLRSTPRCLDDRQRKVRAVEPGHDDFGLFDAERRQDVRPDVRRRGGGESSDASRLQVLEDPAQASVVGTEIVAPLTDAVGFIHRDEVHRNAADRGQESGVTKPFRRHVEEVEFTALQGGECPCPVVVVAGHGGGSDPLAL